MKVRYGLVWICSRAIPALADTNAGFPDIPELEGPGRWACVPSRADQQAAHHSMVIDNVSDFSHAYLHRKYRPFSKVPT